MIRVMVVDDEALIRSGFQLILDSAPDIEVVDACEGVTAVERVSHHQPDVVLLDVRMPQVDGLTVLAELARSPHPPAVGMLTTFDTEAFITQALALGAAGFLLKDTEPEQLIHAVRVLAAGGSVLSPTVTRTVIGGYVGAAARPEASAQLSGMSEREKVVLALVGEGLSNADIGRRLHLSPATVKDHVSSVLAKLGVANRVQAAVVARSAGLTGAGGGPDDRGGAR